MGLFCHAYHERLRFVLVIIGVGQAVHGDAAVYYLVAFIDKIVCKAAVGEPRLDWSLAVVSSAHARPLKAQGVKAIVVVGRIVHHAAAKLDIMLHGKRLDIAVGKAFAVMDMLKMPPFCYSEYVARALRAE